MQKAEIACWDIGNVWMVNQKDGRLITVLRVICFMSHIYKYFEQKVKRRGGGVGSTWANYNDEEG